jgi:uncharacterized membrane protein YcfT
MKHFCIWLVIYLNCTLIHGLTNLKFKRQAFDPNASQPPKIQT